MDKALFAHALDKKSDLPNPVCLQAAYKVRAQ